MIKQYRIEYNYWSCVIEFNTEIFTMELLQECLDFFSWEYDNEGDLYEEYAKKIAKKVLYLLVENELGSIESRFKELEGVPPIDGSFGVKLISFDSFEFEDCEFTSEKIA
ncbi:hypothetical protein [Myroides odoratimimus]|uniref:hypothetical protein n=1 Tax=Myroides odoratimimus TaxID=76832 RepID=UPI002577B300|nr:hypothetical protein [Myroides odoratimimus]MDM1529019.1 DUF2528 family protein [Myroides odoratimimus]